MQALHQLGNEVLGVIYMGLQTSTPILAFVSEKRQRNMKSEKSEKKEISERKEKSENIEESEKKKIIKSERVKRKTCF